jgi:hypothetical protein
VNTIAELERKLEKIRQLGYEVHFDWFGGTGGGACQMGNRCCLFLDLAVGAEEHLATANDLLRQLGHDEKRVA